MLPKITNYFGEQMAVTFSNSCKLINKNFEGICLAPAGTFPQKELCIFCKKRIYRYLPGSFKLIYEHAS